MKRSIMFFSAIITVAGITAFGLVSDTNTNKDKTPINSVNKKLLDFGINGGISIDYRTGLVTQFVSNDNNMPFSYRVQGKYTPNVAQQFRRLLTKDKIQKAKLIDDFIENYPVSWIKEYRSVTIETVIDGKKIIATSPNNVINKEQKALLNSLAVPSGIDIKIRYNKQNYDDSVEERQMNISIAIPLETEAEYIGGYNQLISYLKENSLSQITAKNFSHLPQPSISFVINEQGETENVKLTNSSRDEGIDNLLIELVQKMPKWTPAKNVKGLPIKQEFVLVIGQDGC